MVVLAGLLGKSEQHRLGYEELKGETIETEIMLVLNSSLRTFCERHNKTKERLEDYEELKT